MVLDNDEQKSRIIDIVSIKRLGTPEDNGLVVKFLREEDSSFVASQT